MNRYEELAELEHIQWEHWSKSIATELKELKLLVDKGETKLAIKKIDDRLERWERNWKPYNDLAENIKDYDREWVDKIIEIGVIMCPIWQCGGFMEVNGDEQTPDLVCTNCSGKYSFRKFETKTTHEKMPKLRKQNDTVVHEKA